ncbi:MAG: MBL fold metallo-hydrolase [Bacteroides sp.]|nr:MBL fold metallo-hydrolase [Eubacterium sp.]MCM1419193.1 MBL fold metallo-hydrolase [Roseburia sp.]MCM1463040.1 MBL fold metallo-hydrolase [Bacteroides sp.]
MFEFREITDKSGYIESPAKIGVYRAEGNDVYLIDSGGDKDAGRKTRKILEEKGWRLRGILNTHSNADHIGGNRYLQQQTGCKVFSGGIEAAFTAAPILEPSFLYGGYPFRELRHKFLLADGSTVSDFSDPDFPRELTILPLKGHFFDMVGFRTPDGVVYLADCLSSKETLEKYKIGFIYDVAAYLETLEKVAALEAKMFVPAHAPATEEIAPLARYNADKVREIAETILSLCREPIAFEELLKRLFDDLSLTMTFEQYVLVGSTVRSYLAWLKDLGSLAAEFSENRMLWRRV